MNSSKNSNFLPQVQVSLNHYNFENYVSIERFASYGIQLKLILSYLKQCENGQIQKNKQSNEFKLLECGIGAGVLKILVQHFCPHINYFSCDVDPNLHPDKIGSITNLPYDDNEVHVVCSFEVMEHIPSQLLEKALNECSRVASKYVIISVPDVTPHLGITFQHHFFSKFSPKKNKCLRNHVRAFFERKTWKFLLDLPSIIRLKHYFKGEHYWELGKRGFTLCWFKECCERNQLIVLEQFRNVSNPYHRFFVLKKGQTG